MLQNVAQTNNVLNVAFCLSLCTLCLTSFFSRFYFRGGFIVKSLMSKRYTYILSVRFFFFHIRFYFLSRYYPLPHQVIFQKEFIKAKTFFMTLVFE